ncbi:MAG: hypothetical protein US72_C0025G0001 [Microgenomates group bacterium GW2011_GWC1_38_12]|nr:MAG: hypothetical protein US72_C0025G0001 [Microgenomates group bacterium GW2011_GWC1_38_12]
MSSNSVPHTIILPPYARFPAPQCGDWGKLLRYFTGNFNPENPRTSYEEQLESIYELIEASRIDGRGVTIDAGTGTGLSAYEAAREYPDSTVISLDNSHAPHPYITDKYPLYRGHIRPPEDNGSFVAFFGLNLFDLEVEAGKRVDRIQILSPRPPDITNLLIQGCKIAKEVILVPDPASLNNMDSLRDRISQVSPDLCEIELKIMEISDIEGILGTIHSEYIDPDIHNMLLVVIARPRE